MRNVLYVQYWDIIKEKEDEYVDFILEEYNPVIKNLGFKIVGGYYVEVGEGPHTIACFSLDDVVKINELVTTEKFIFVTNKLTNFVRNRRAALFISTDRVNQNEYKLQENVWKWNFHYNVKPNKKQQYKDFINKIVKAFENIDFVELTQEWRVIYGGTADYILELTFKHPYDIGRLMYNNDFRDLEKVIRKEIVEIKSSKILRTTERFEKPRWLKL